MNASSSQQIKKMRSFVSKRNIFFHLKKTANAVLSPIFPGLGNKIQPSVLQALQKEKTTKRDVIILGITTFEYRTQRPQHFAKELVKNGHRVFYIDSQFIPFHPGPKFVPLQIRQHDDGLFIVQLSCPTNLFIYSDVPSSHDIQILVQSLNYLIQTANISNPLLKVD